MTMPCDPPAVIDDAAGLALRTGFSYEDWHQALAIIGGRPDRLKLAAAIADMAVRGVPGKMLGDLGPDRPLPYAAYCLMRTMRAYGGQP